MSKQPKFGKPATRQDLATWSTMSRNSIEGCLARFGVLPLRGRFPWPRVYASLLGIAPETTDEAAVLDAGLVRLGTVADRLCIGAETLLADVRAGKGGFPPLYVFGPRQHLFLKGQIDEMLGSPRNAYPDLSPVDGHVFSRSQLPAALDAEKTAVAEVFEDKRSLPAHVITAGVRRFIVADVAHRLRARQASNPDVEEADDPVPTAGSSVLARALAAGRQAPGDALSDRTRSRVRAPEGDVSHGKPSEAKRSGT
ncbi:hypothetical protein [Aquicoccus sp. SU-CL01552]|uniref:hypothetical protein n=1 Tax=Aquicoccus sp. SU-CL01552 TaxID=3127656 RepID=UPI003101E4F4